MKNRFVLLLLVASMLSALASCAPYSDADVIHPGSNLGFVSSANLNLSALSEEFTVESSLESNYCTYVNNQIISSDDSIHNFVNASKKGENHSSRLVFFDENRKLSAYYDIIADDDKYYFVSYENNDGDFVQSKEEFSCLKEFNIYGTPSAELKEIGERSWYLKVVVLAKDESVTYEDVNEYFNRAFSSVYVSDSVRDRQFKLIETKRVSLTDADKEMVNASKNDAGVFISLGDGLVYNEEIYAR